MQRIIKFFREVVRETKKVSWPKRKEINPLYNYGYFVTTVAFFALFFAALGAIGISELIRVILQITDSIVHGIMKK